MPRKKVKKKKTTFEESLAELESIVSDLERGDVGLEEALARYEDGVKHLSACYELLERAERRIEIISGVDAEGNPIARKFDEDEDSASPSPMSTRPGEARRRVSKSKPVRDVDDDPALF